MSNNVLTPEQVERLVEKASQSPMACWTVLRKGPRLSAEQQQRMVDGACKSTVFASLVLTDVPWLTEPQKSQLKLVS